MVASHDHHHDHHHRAKASYALVWCRGVITCTSRSSMARHSSTLEELFLLLNGSLTGCFLTSLHNQRQTRDRHGDAARKPVPTNLPRYHDRHSTEIVTRKTPVPRRYDSTLARIVLYDNDTAPIVKITCRSPPLGVVIVLVQYFHIHVRGGSEHIVWLVLPTDAVEGTSYEIGPLVWLWRRLGRSSIALSSGGNSQRTHPIRFGSECTSTSRHCYCMTPPWLNESLISTNISTWLNPQRKEIILGISCHTVLRTIL